jgi:hypothetical protein
MNIDQCLDERGVSKVLHFTTNLGIVGIINNGGIISRKALGTSEKANYIKLLNCPTWKTPDWEDHISLSIERINKGFWAKSVGWHEKEPLFWVILEIDPSVLSHPGLSFSTTNSAYDTAIIEPGTAGLVKLYGHTVLDRNWNGHQYKSQRHAGMPSAEPTSVQAEVLYPKSLPVSFIRWIHARTEEDANNLAGYTYALNSDLEIKVSPSMFE